MSRSVDWASLDRTMNLVEERPAGGGRTEQGGSGHAREALSQILGDAALREAVDHYVASEPGSELARSVLWLLHPRPAMERCYELFKSGDDVDRRRAAVELLRVVADRSVLPWVHEFLADSDPEVQVWGIGVVDQLAWSGLIEHEEAAALVESARDHPNRQVRDRAAFIAKYLAERLEDER